MTATIAALGAPATLDLLAMLRRVGPERVRAYDGEGVAQDIDVQGTRRRWERVAHTLGTLKRLTRVEFLTADETLLGQWEPGMPAAEPPPPPPPEERALALLLRAQDVALARQESSQGRLIDGFVKLAECSTRQSEALAARAASAEAEAAELRLEVSRLTRALAAAEARAKRGDDSSDGLRDLVKDVVVAAIGAWAEGSASASPATGTPP